MNNFLELHSSADYRNTNRPYYTGTWEMIHIASDYLIPFQFSCSSSDVLTIEAIRTDGTAFDMTTRFWGDTLIDTMTKTGGGTWSVIADFVMTPGTIDNGGFMTSNTMTLTAGQSYYIEVVASAYDDPAGMDVILLKAAAEIWTEDLGSWDGAKYFTVDATGSDYTIKIVSADGTNECLVNNAIVVYPSTITNSPPYWWYDGGQLTGSIPSTFYLRITCGADIFYSDWMDVCTFTGKLKYKISSEFDYGGIKYDEGYEQWIYKNASVRRAPRAEIEQTGSQRNGVLILEKSVSAVRYKMSMKCTETEYEAFVHSIGGTVEVTDQTGKVYAPTNIEINDPQWFRSNGIVEISFIDENNVNIWTKNNSSL